jgi:hypothetical protein
MRSGFAVQIRELAVVAQVDVDGGIARRRPDDLERGKNVLETCERLGCAPLRRELCDQQLELTTHLLDLGELDRLHCERERDELGDARREELERDFGQSVAALPPAAYRQHLVCT